MRDLKSKIAEELPYLRRFARALTNDDAAADDLVQDTVERAITRLHLFDETRSLRTWLFTILRNLFVNQLRRAKRQGEHIALDEVAEHSLAQRLSDAGSAIDIRNAVMALQQDYREVVLLVTLEGMSYEETAKIIGAPVGTVMSRLSRGRAKLKQLLDREISDAGKKKRDQR